jgi:hypothetical protein
MIAQIVEARSCERKKIQLKENKAYNTRLLPLYPIYTRGTDT